MSLSHDILHYEILQSTLRLPVATATPANNKSEGRGIVKYIKHASKATRRMLIKIICNKKIRDNLYNEDDPMLITKNFGHMLSQILNLSK